MNLRIFLSMAFILSILLSSCEYSIQGEEDLSPQGEIIYAEKASRTNNAITDEMLTDATLIANEIQKVSPKKSAQAFDWYKSQTDLGKDVDMALFLKDRLNITSALVDKVQNYSSSQRDLIQKEVNSPDSEGIMYQRYMNLDDNPTNPWARQEPCAPECCGGWRPIKLIILLEACILGNPLGCLAGLEELYEFTVDGCLS